MFLYFQTSTLSTEVEKMKVEISEHEVHVKDLVSFLEIEQFL